MWERLGKLATKRKTTITTLLVEGAEYILDAGGYSKPDPPSQEETITRLEALQKELDALALKVSELGVQVEGQVSPQASANNALPVPSTDDSLTKLTQRVERIEKAIASLTQALAKVETAQTTASVPKRPLTQGQLGDRLGLSDKAVEKARRKGSDYFASWSRERDPEGMAWKWEGEGGRGTPLRFFPSTPKT
jgi:hypothetical protein